MGAQETVERAGRQVKNSPLLDALVRGGLVAYGLVYLILAWLALQLVFGQREGRVSKDGALHQFAKEDWGSAVLWAVFVGFAALVVWQALEAWVGHRSRQGRSRTVARAQSAGRVVLYGVVGFTAAKTAASGHSGSGSPDSYSKDLMSTDAGTWLVGAFGVGVIAYAIGSFVRGVTDRYREHLDLDGNTGWTGTATTVLARAGYVSRAVAFGIVGSLFIWAAWTNDPQESGGLDVALSRVLHGPFGPAALTAVAVGFACYGLFNLFRARYHDG